MSVQEQLLSLATRIYNLKNAVPEDAQANFDFQDYVSQAGLQMARLFLDGVLRLEEIPLSRGVDGLPIKHGELILLRAREAMADRFKGDKDHPAYPGISERDYVGAAFFELLLYRWLIHKYPERIRWNPGLQMTGTLSVHPIPDAEARRRLEAEMEARRKLLATEPIHCPRVFHLGKGEAITHRQGTCVSLDKSQVDTYGDACRLLAELTVGPPGAAQGHERQSLTKSISPMSDFTRLADELDRVKAQSTKPKHLYVQMRRATIQAGRLALKAAENGILPKLRAQATLMAKPTDDGTAQLFLQMFVMPYLKATYPERVKADAGVFNFPGVKTDKTGRVLGRDGKPLEVVTHPDGSMECVGEPARETDHYDAADTLRQLRKLSTRA